MTPKISPMEIAYLLAVAGDTGVLPHASEDEIKNLKACGFLTRNLKLTRQGEALADEVMEVVASVMLYFSVPR